MFFGWEGVAGDTSNIARYVRGNYPETFRRIDLDDDYWPKRQLAIPARMN